jgi:hypothetical protein
MNNPKQSNIVPQCSIIEEEYKISQNLCKFINNVSSIDKMHILAYIIYDNSYKKKAFDLWKKSVI